MKSNRKWIGCLLIVVMCICSGCSRTELESRCFPLLVVVDWLEKEQEVTYCAGFPRADNSGGSTGQTTELQVSMVQGENFKKSKWNYEEDLNKFADYNHLKVLVLGEAFVDNEDAYRAMLEYLGETEEFPRNTFVCVVADTDKLLALDEKLPQDLGTYLEEYLEAA